MNLFSKTNSNGENFAGKPVEESSSEAYVSGLKVLIVDDDRWIHKILGKNLESLTFEIISAYDAYECVALAIKYIPDLIFLDIILPEVRGEFVLKMLKAIDITANIPIIIMSGNLDKEVLGATYKHGAKGYIAKPFSKNIIITKLRQCLGASFDEVLNNCGETFDKDAPLETADSILIV